MKTESNKSIQQGKSALLRATWLVVLAAVLLALPAESYATRFGIVTDCHHANANYDPPTSRYCTDSLDKLEDCVTTLNDQGLDFLIELGDFVDGNPETMVADNFLQHVEEIEDVFEEFDGPTYHVLGNHDLDYASKTEFLDKVSSSESYYSFDVKGLHCIVLDACYMKSGEDYVDYENNKESPYSWTNTWIPPDELAWLEADLAATMKLTIVFIHQMLAKSQNLPEDILVKNDVEGPEEMHVLPILENSGKVIAVFQGHHHEGDYVEINGIHYYTLKGLVEGPYPQNNSYAIVEVQPCGSITVTGYGNATSMQLENNLDLDCDGVPDAQDECLDTPSDVFVGPLGCSAYQWCTEPKYDPKNHGDFVSCVAYIAEAWLDEGFIDEEEKNEIVSEAAQSGVGKR